MDIGTSIDAKRTTTITYGGGTARIGKSVAMKKKAGANWDFSMLDLPKLTGKNSGKNYLASQRAMFRRSVAKLGG